MLKERVLTLKNGDHKIHGDIICLKKNRIRLFFSNIRPSNDRVKEVFNNSNKAGSGNEYLEAPPIILTFDMIK